MLILNYAHPLTAEQMAQIEQRVGASVAEVKHIKVQLNQAEPLIPQVTALADAAGLANEEWSGRALLVNPPSLNFVAVALIAELHGRMGYFPACLRLRPIEGSVPPRFEVAEVLNLQDVRNAARGRRD
ncbi:MAG: CRISPR-associated protein Csx15 [Chloroflexota bacterium]